MCIYICAVSFFFFILIKYATRGRITVIHASHFPPFWPHVVRPRCLAGFESIETSFSLKDVATRLDSTRSVSLCQAINKW